jgi:hypothetical protein
MALSGGRQQPIVKSKHNRQIALAFDKAMKRSSVCFWRGYVIHWRRNLTPKVIQGKAWSRVCQVLHQRPGAERLTRRLSSILAVLVQRVILICTPYSLRRTEYNGTEYVPWKPSRRTRCTSSLVQLIFLVISATIISRVAFFIRLCDGRL